MSQCDDRPPLTGSDPYVRVGRKKDRMPRNRHTVEQIITKLDLPGQVKRPPLVGTELTLPLGES